MSSIKASADRVIKAYGGNVNKLRNVLALFPLGIIITDLDGRIIYYNQAQAKIDDLDPKEAEGRIEVETLAPVVGPNIMEACQKTAQPILGYIFPYRTFKGREVNAAYWVYPIFEKSRVIGAICFVQPLLGENQSRNYRGQAIQWPSTVPINIPQKTTVGANPAFQKALLTARSNAGNPFPVLISGETGCGKEMLAKLIHQSSARRESSYLALNCAAIPGQLLEGLLFGTVKGSFTGAIDRPGLMEDARGGTLYLDEIDSMPLELQPKLLRAIQEMRISRIGSSTEIELDFKLVSSIGSTPQEALSSGRLRADLFYRLAVVVINIPPLRDRRDDLELLASHFLNKYNNVLGKQALSLEDNLWELMRAYHWPGNVRELEHMLAGALAQTGDEHVISLSHVPDHYLQAFANLGHSGSPKDFPAPGPQAGPEPAPLPEIVQRRPGRPPRGPESPAAALGPVERLKLEEEELRDCLRRSQGNVSRAAQLLGVSRQLFNYRMMKFGLNRRDFQN